MFDKLSAVEERYNKVEQLLTDPKICKDREAYQKYTKEHSELSKIVTVFRDYKKISIEIEENKEIFEEGDPELKELARQEIDILKNKKENLEQKLILLLMPKDPNDEKNVIVEIRAGTGGEEAGLFVADLFRMYSRYAENMRWKVEILDQHQTGVGGLKEIIASFLGKGAYSKFKYESGTHRVQRVPATEAQGRIHTSAVTVAVLPEAEEVEVNIDPTEIRVEVYRSSGPGGQSVNTTDSAVRITHLSTGMVVTCQDEKSQHKNKAKAMKVLRARLYDKMQSEQDAKRAEDRKTQVGSGDRSERIRTYNFPQSRVTDHRIGLTLYRLESVLQGDIDEIIEALITYYRAKALQDEKPVTTK
ncbi:MAG: peptide chain release factor 1 [Desulfobacterales bacterium]|nr:peptide chain release factor 1 [Desulfobacterales bacterium]